MNNNIGFMTDYYFNLLEQTEIEHGIFEATVQGAFLENMSLNESVDMVIVNEGFKDVMHKIWEGIVKIWHKFLELLRKIRDFFLKGKLSKKANDLNKRCTNLINTIIKTGKEENKISVADVNTAQTLIVIPPESLALSASDFTADSNEKGTTKIESIRLIFDAKLLAMLSSAFKKSSKEMSYAQFKMTLMPIITINKMVSPILKKKKDKRDKENKEYLNSVGSADSDFDEDDDYVDYVDDDFDEEDIFKDANIIDDVGKKIISDCAVNDLSDYGNFDNIVSDTDTKLSKLNSEEFTKVISKVCESISPNIANASKSLNDMIEASMNTTSLLLSHLGVYFDIHASGKEYFDDLIMSGNVVDNFMKLYTEKNKNIDVDDSKFVSFELGIDVVKEIQRKVISVGKNNKQLDVYISSIEKSISNLEDAFKSIMNNSNTAPEVASILKVLYNASMINSFKKFTTEMFKSGLRLSGDLLDYYNKLIGYVEKVMGLAQ